MMTYFEVRERLHGLEEFRRMFREYADFTNRESNLPAQMLKAKMEPMLLQTVDSLNQVDLGSLVTKDAPARGGRRIKINVVRAVFRPHLIRHFQIRDREVIELLDKGILRYQTRLWQQRLQLFNPLFWLWQIIAFLADLPFWIAKKAGFDISRVDTLSSVRLYRIVAQVAVFGLLIKWSGLFDLIRFDILAL